MLRYTGGGYGGWLPGVPARDLNDAEVEELGGKDALLATGLYEQMVHGSFGAEAITTTSPGAMTTLPTYEKLEEPTDETRRKRR